MDQQELRRLEDLCIQEWAPWCTARCPVHVDVRGMIAAVVKNNWDAAAKVLRKSVPFPGIISRICDRPCESVCKRGEAGEAISIRELERAVLRGTTQQVKAGPKIPGKSARSAVIGAGLSGLTAALDLAKKGYNVTVFEKEQRLGGSVRTCSEEELPEETVLQDFRIFDGLSVDFRLNTTVGSDVALADLEQEFAAIYMGMGIGIGSHRDFGLDRGGSGRIRVDWVTFQTSRPGVFAGGRAVSGSDVRSPIGSISAGRRAAISIDRYIQKVSLTASREREGAYDTRLFTSMHGIERLLRVPVSKPSKGYSPAEAVVEASRCIQCECMECVKICEYLAHYKGYPKKYIRQVYNNLSIVMGRRHGNRLINSCSLCGLCKEVCPEDLNMGDVCKAARIIMVNQGKMPPSAHEFALMDMAFSNSDEAALARHQPGTTSSAYLFFPGCRLSGSSPEHVSRTYAYLTSRLPGGVGLMLGCCGAPAEWTGRTETVSQVIGKFEGVWSAMGGPKLILACSSCYRVFKDHLPEAESVSLWEVMDQEGLPDMTVTCEQGIVAVHDPCTSRHEPGFQERARSLVRKLGYEIEELPLSRDMTECCGFGGLMSFANREVAEKVIRKRIAGIEPDLVAYCAVCRDRFTSHGKPTRHLLDLIFRDTGSDKTPIRPPDYSQQRENRARLKNTLLKDLWSETSVESREHMEIELRISDEVRDLMQDRMILVEDLRLVIEWAERTENKLVHKETGHYLAHFRPATVTYWVEYSPEQGGFTVHNAYSHRMRIVEELKP